MWGRRDVWCVMTVLTRRCPWRVHDAFFRWRDSPAGGASLREGLACALSLEGRLQNEMLRYTSSSDAHVLIWPNGHAHLDTIRPSNFLTFFRGCSCTHECLQLGTIEQTHVVFGGSSRVYRDFVYAHTGRRLILITP